MLTHQQQDILFYGALSNLQKSYGRSLRLSMLWKIGSFQENLCSPLWRQSIDTRSWLSVDLGCPWEHRAFPPPLKQGRRCFHRHSVALGGAFLCYPETSLSMTVKVCCCLWSMHSFEKHSTHLEAAVVWPQIWIAGPSCTCMADGCSQYYLLSLSAEW